ncbi:MAG: ABC transporter substrate-binding protein [Faecalibacterium sp.]
MKKISRRSFLKGMGATAATLSATSLLTACGSTSSSGDASSTSDATTTTTTSSDVINIASTSTLGSLNPLLIDATWINMYAMTLMFNPLVALNEEAEFEAMLVDSITTDDNLTYTLHINDAATWSDGTPITSADLEYTFKMLTSATVGNLTMMMYALVGTDDATGYRADGVEDLEGFQIVDDKTVTLTFKWEINPISFQTSYAMYIFPVPAHVLSEVPEADLATSDWFSAPTVVSGPYMATAVDANNYITYTANENYWMGAPKVSSLNIKIVEGAQLLSGLTSGEIDVVPPLLASFVQSDYDSVLALENVNAAYGDAYAVENIFINCNTVPEVEIRQAMLCALDRNVIIDGLLGGAADLCDGFAVPAGPYNRDLPVTAYDVTRAQELVATATANGWDPSTTYELYLNGGEDTLINAATIAQTYWAAAGINVNLNTVDIDTLMTMCIEGSGDMYGVQYTYPPMDPAQVDISWVLDYWCFYESDVVPDALANIWATSDPDVYADELYKIDADVQENVPLMVLYVNGPLGAVANRVSGATANMYGCLNNVHEWEIV